jgi:hypothetical protein
LSKVFKRRQSLQSHARSKHGTTFAATVRPKNMGVANRGGRIAKKPTLSAAGLANHSGHAQPATHTQFYSPLLSSPVKAAASVRQIHPQQLQQLPQDIMLQLPTQPLQPSVLTRGGQLLSSHQPDRNSFELMPDIQNILAKNKAVMPNLTTTTSTGVLTGTLTGTTSMAPSQRVKKAPNAKGKRQQNHNWARTLSQADQPLILDSRLSDPVTRNQVGFGVAVEHEFSPACAPVWCNIPKRD